MSPQCPNCQSVNINTLAGDLFSYKFGCNHCGNKFNLPEDLHESAPEPIRKEKDVMIRTDENGRLVGIGPGNRQPPGVFLELVDCISCGSDVTTTKKLADGVFHTECDSCEYEWNHTSTSHEDEQKKMEIQPDELAGKYPGFREFFLTDTLDTNEWNIPPNIGSEYSEFRAHYAEWVVLDTFEVEEVENHTETFLPEGSGTNQNNQFTVPRAEAIKPIKVKSIKFLMGRSTRILIGTLCDRIQELTDEYSESWQVDSEREQWWAAALIRIAQLECEIEVSDSVLAKEITKKKEAENLQKESENTHVKVVKGLRKQIKEQEACEKNARAFLGVAQYTAAINHDPDEAIGGVRKLNQET